MITLFWARESHALFGSAPARSRMGMQRECSQVAAACKAVRPRPSVASIKFSSPSVAPETRSSRSSALSHNAAFTE